MDALADRIRAARKHAGLTQPQLAARIPISPLTLSRWERGAHTPPEYQRRRLAAVLDLPEDHFEDPDEEQAAQLRAVIEPFAESLVAALIGALRDATREGAPA